MNKVVAVSYELEVEGNIADKAGSEKPLEYIHGTGMLLPKFEEAVEGKEPGETFDFVLSPEDGYGAYDPSYMIDLPKGAFAIDGEVREDLLVVGNMIPMLNAGGQVVQGVVAAVGEETVTMDFNHPMAGKTLNFDVEVVEVRDVTPEDLAPKGGCSCGCDHDNCGDGCEGCGEDHHCGDHECNGDHCCH